MLYVVESIVTVDVVFESVVSVDVEVESVVVVVVVVEYVIAVDVVGSCSCCQKSSFTKWSDNYTKNIVFLPKFSNFLCNMDR